MSAGGLAHRAPLLRMQLGAAEMLLYIWSCIQLLSANHYINNWQCMHFLFM